MGRPEDLANRISSFGEAAIDELILDRQSEELFIEFKRSSDNGANRRLSDNDRRHLAKAISGFGNSEGGLVIWGVDCRADREAGDVASNKVKIQNPRRFKSWLEGSISGLTLPPHPGVTHLAIDDGQGNGFVVTHIPKSYMAPHQCIQPPQYYMRVGSNFEPVPHGVLAGMFGRVPQPQVFHMWNYPPAQLVDGIAHFEVGLLLTNKSPTIARDAYVSLMIDPPEPPSQIRIVFADTTNWAASQAFGCITQVIANENYRIAPETLVQPIRLSFMLTPPFSGDFEMRITTGCSGSPVSEMRHRISAPDLASLFNDFVSRYPDVESGHEFVTGILGGADQGDSQAGAFRES